MANLGQGTDSTKPREIAMQVERLMKAIAVTKSLPGELSARFDAVLQPLGPSCPPGVGVLGKDQVGVAVAPLVSDLGGVADVLIQANTAFRELLERCEL